MSKTEAVPEGLLGFKANRFSQNGEDGIIAELIRRVGTHSSQVCCEFGAWDGCHFSNTRELVLQGWTGIMIEADKSRFERLVEVYREIKRVHCINAVIGDAENSLSSVMRRHGLGSLLNSIDFLSVDIDGLDYEVLKTLDIRPKVICVEVNAGHDPTTRAPVAPHVARENVGQPFQLFTDLAESWGYGLVCYTGNAFYVQRWLMEELELRSVPNEVAYRAFLRELTVQERHWLYLVNEGLVPPYYSYANSYLNRSALGIGVTTAMSLRAKTKLASAGRGLLQGIRRRSRRDD